MRYHHTYQCRIRFYEKDSRRTDPDMYAEKWLEFAAYNFFEAVSIAQGICTGWKMATGCSAFMDCIQTIGGPSTVYTATNISGSTAPVIFQDLLDKRSEGLKSFLNVPKGEDNDA